MYWKKSRAFAHAIYAEKNHIHGILKSIEEGLLRIEPGLILQPEDSEHLDAILGVGDWRGQEMATFLVRTSLTPDEQQKTMACLEAALGEDILNWDLNVGNLPTDWIWEERDIVCYWQPILEDQRVKSVLLAMRDVSQSRRLQREKQQLQIDSDRLFHCAREIMSGRPKAAIHFLNELPIKQSPPEKLGSRSPNTLGHDVGAENLGPCTTG